MSSIFGYLDITNGARITNLSPTDPFAIFAFALLCLMIPVAIIMLAWTLRRSVNSVIDGIRHEKAAPHTHHRGVRGLRRGLRYSAVPSTSSSEENGAEV
ncbi:hypothetical protein LTR36_009492 [Oleoguttula mirabilis]|uniref:Uncharacterized protein n=1 Tax=Oleoguttula mirabilis TaxID=1507867 RepID=A0AAV9JSV4_9PEZI|nr:hypothetical protein LTR36_009492 [Oleoguttula mirabilis]